MWNGLGEATYRRTADFKNATFDSSEKFISVFQFFPLSMISCFLFSDKLVCPQTLASENVIGKTPDVKGGYLYLNRGKGFAKW